MICEAFYFLGAIDCGTAKFISVRGQRTAKHID